MPEETLSLFQTMDIPTLQGNLVELLCRTAREKGRIEITNCDGGVCVMISKEELEALEMALEVLSTTEQVRKLHQTVERFVRYEDQDEQVPAPPAVPV